MRVIILPLLLLLIVAPALGARIAGTAYTQDLDVAKYALLTINTTPAQRVLLTDGTYDITVPAGTYLMAATYNQRGTQYDDELVITILDDGIYSYDLILFPAERNETQQLPSVDELFIPAPGQAPRIGWLPATLLLIAIAALAATLGSRRWWHRKPTKTQDTAPAPPAADLPADLDAIIAVLKEEGGRTTQKELRKRIPCSEAKMSMMLTELEAKGRIERIKKGRGNLIVLK